MLIWENWLLWLGALQQSAVGDSTGKHSIHPSKALISGISCSLCSLLREPDDELGIGLRRVKSHHLHVALDSSRLTVWNARFGNDGVGARAILLGRSLVVSSGDIKTSLAFVTITLKSGSCQKLVASWQGTCQGHTFTFCVERISDCHTGNEHGPNHVR